ncbi:hypothetical protein D3C73_1088290 [compost metagenome]
MTTPDGGVRTFRICFCKLIFCPRQKTSYAGDAAGMDFRRLFVFREMHEAGSGSESDRL